MVEDDAGDDVTGQSQVNSGMLPNDIVNLLAAREKYSFVCPCICTSSVISTMIGVFFV